MRRDRAAHGHNGQGGHPAAGLFPRCYSGKMHAKAPASRTPRELVDDNRRFYDSLWSGCRLVDPDRFNTWPLVQSLLPASGAAASLRLEVAPGLRPRLPIEGTQFVDISAPALKLLSERGGRVTLGEVTALPFADASFDLVCALDIIEHVEDDDGALSEIARVAKPGTLPRCCHDAGRLTGNAEDTSGQIHDRKLLS